MRKFNIAALRTRLLSGFILGPVVILIVYYGGWPFAALILICTGVSLYEWFHLALKTNHRILYMVFGVVYIVVGFGSCYVLRTLDVEAALFFIALIWSSDVGAYFTGKILGGPKMARGISPNKTWAGFAGAMFFPVLISIIWLTYLMGVLELAEYVLLFLAIAAIGATGQAGDLMISFVKRKAGVKDTGDLIPGHGGLLDRIDAMMLAAPVFLVLVGMLSYVS